MEEQKASNAVRCHAQIRKQKTGEAPVHIKQMIITKAVSWVVPEGIHGAKIVDASIIEKKGKQQLRLIFQIMGLKHPTKKYQAKRTYEEKDGSRIREDLTTILGEQLAEIVDEDGQLLPHKLHLLEGEQVKIEIIHVRNERYQEPYCQVRRIYG